MKTISEKTLVNPRKHVYSIYLNRVIYSFREPKVLKEINVEILEVETQEQRGESE